MEAASKMRSKVSYVPITTTHCYSGRKMIVSDSDNSFDNDADNQNNEDGLEERSHKDFEIYK